MDWEENHIWGNLSYGKSNIDRHVIDTSYITRRTNAVILFVSYLSLFGEITSIILFCCFGPNLRGINCLVWRVDLCSFRSLIRSQYALGTQNGERSAPSQTCRHDICCAGYLVLRHPSCQHQRTAVTSILVSTTAQLVPQASQAALHQPQDIGRNMICMWAILTSAPNPASLHREGSIMPSSMTGQHRSKRSRCNSQ